MQKQSVRWSKTRLVSCYDLLRIKCYFVIDTHAYFVLGCKLIFLPPYSPDRNPIEHAFGYIKSQLRRANRELVVSDISEACYKVTPEMAQGWFRCAGYM